MTKKSNKTQGFLAVCAVAMLAVMAFSPMVFSDDSDAANATATINIQPGQSWSWTPTFPSGLSPAVTVSGSESAMPADNASFAATSGNASVSSGKVTVTIPDDYSGSKYYVKVKAATTNPTQVAYYEITFNVATFGVAYNISSVVAKVGTAISNMTPTISGGVTAKSYAITGTLPTGLSFNSSTGVISGTPTAHKASAEYTVTATLNTTPVQTVSTKVTIGAYTNITASNYTVYAIADQTEISIPGVTMPTGTVLGSLVTKVGDTTVTTSHKGMSINTTTGAISGTPTDAGSYVFTQTYTATAATGGSSATRTVTVVVEDKIVLTNAASVNDYVGHASTASIGKTAGPSSVTWSVQSVTKDGKSTSTDGFTVSNTGVVTCATSVTKGTYVVTVKAVSSNNTSNTSGATGTTPSTNYATATATFVVESAIAGNDATFYMAENGVYNNLTLTSNVSGATFSIQDAGDLEGKIAISSAGVVTPGSGLSGLADGEGKDYTVTVQVVDPNNSGNTDTLTLTVHVAPTLAYTNAPTAGAINE